MIHYLLGLIFYTRCICFASASESSWIDFQRLDNVAFFLFDFPARIERYDANPPSSWLSPIDLPSSYGLPTSFAVDGLHIFVVFGRAVYRYDKDGSNSTHVMNVGDTNSISSHVKIVTDDNLVFLIHGGQVTSLDRTKNVVIDNKDVRYNLQGLSISASKNKIIGRTTGISPSDIYYIQYDDAGMLGEFRDSPYHGDYRGGSRTWVFPDDSLVLDSSGNVYSIDSLKHINAFSSEVSDIDWYGEKIPIVLEGNSLVAYDQALLPTGSYDLGTNYDRLLVQGEDIVLFRSSETSDGNGISTTTVPVASLSPPDPSEPLDPNGLSFKPSIVFLDRRGILNLFSEKYQNIFRWDPSTQTYIDSIGLVGYPLYVAYSNTTDTIFTAYETGLIRSISGEDLSQETPFATLPSAPLGLSTAGRYLFTVDNSGAWVTHYTFSPGGTIISSVDWNYRSNEYVWNEANQKMYFFRDDSSPNDILWEEINADGIAYPELPQGGIGKKQDSPDHSSSGIVHPIRLKPDGSVVLLGSGVFRDALSLERLSISLANEITDAVFLNDRIVTIRNIVDLAQIQEWAGPTMELGEVIQLPGTSFALLGLDQKLLVITIGNNDVPSFYIFDESLAILSPETLRAPLSATAKVLSSQIDLEWIDISGESGYLIERNDGTSSGWTEIGTTSMSVTAYSDGFVDPSIGSYGYRIIATAETIRSPPSDEVWVQFGPPNSPAGLNVTVLSSSSVKLVWEPSPDADRYVIERKISTSLSDFRSVATITYEYDSLATSYNDHALSPGTSYSYRVLAGNSFGNSNPANAANVLMPQEALMGSPHLYEVSSTYNSSDPMVQLGFSYDLSSVDQYEISRSEDSANWSSLAKIDASTFSGSFFDGNVSYNKRYFYRVRAINRIGESLWSSTKEVTTVGAPLSLTASVDPRQLIVTLAWAFDTPSNTPSRHVLYRKEASEKNRDEDDWDWLVDLSPTLSNFVDASIMEGSGYRYKIHTVWWYFTGASGQTEAVSNVVSVDPMQLKADICGWECMCGDVTVTTNLFSSERCNPLEFLPELGTSPTVDSSITTVVSTASMNESEMSPVSEEEVPKLSTLPPPEPKSSQPSSSSPLNPSLNPSPTQPPSVATKTVPFGVIAFLVLPVFVLS